MKKNYLQILFAILISIGLFQNSATAGDKIKIILLQPPPNMLETGDLWKLSITNSSKENVTIYLQGTVTEEKDGLIVSGKSKSFSVKPGTTNYGYNDFKSGEVSWKNKTYEEAIVRTGNVKSGAYTICVTALFADGSIADQESCIEQKIEIVSEQQITLVTPSDGAEIDPDTLPGLAFMWRDCPLCPPPIVYNLRIVEIKGSQSPDEAMQNSSAFFEQKELKSTTFQYPLSASKFEKGKKYAWQVSSGSSVSEVSLFSIRSAIQVSYEIDSVNCTGTLGHYNFKMTVCVDHDNSTFSSAIVQPFVFSNNCVPSGVTYTITGLNPTLPQTITTPATGTNCITFRGMILTTPPSVVTSIELISSLRWGSNSYEVVNLPSGVFPALNNCCLPISQLPPMVGWWTFDELSGPTFLDRAGYNNVGTQVGALGFNLLTYVNGSLNFNNGYISVQDHIDMNVFQCDSLTIDAWIKTSASGIGPIVEKRQLTPCGQPMGYAFFIQNGKLGFQIGNGISFANYISPAVVPTLNNGSWQFVAVTLKRTISNTVVTLYRDGVAINVSTITPPVGSLNNSAPLLIGCVEPGFTYAGTTFGGDIDEVEIFKRVLTQTQISSIFNAGSAGKCK